MDWRLTVRRLLISVFLIVHLSATILWVIPPCPLRERTNTLVSYYILPLGFWQYWTMFSPDPAQNTLTLEAEVVDAKGLRTVFPFPKLADYTAFQAIPRFRHPKYAANLSVGSFEKQREFAARHVVRQLHPPTDAYPLEVELVYQVRPTPPPGNPVDLMTPLQRSPFATYHFASEKEVRP
ncbi:hypothetical protein SAMN05444166_6921 [Singulisphaera sp. GP187]|uniref:hypothetical protein n=1 Tax=Singulisphaera sp. GP187 TaxID=1882752 RepID=UPI00092BACBB|nr:hypothetical protein [Singulisphaera sp. GP187]SIO62011.1 hypothetical protein SAMN05444166_6921 [Singulisphaera sp. GP187]